jgi:hypothetical protein
VKKPHFSHFQGAHAEAVAVTRTLRSLSRSQMERSERLKQSKKTLEPETTANPRASVFGEKFSTMKERNQNRETLTLGTNRQTMVMAKKEDEEADAKPDENEPGTYLFYFLIPLS